MPVTALADGVRVRIKLTPKAARDRIDGVADDGEGGRVLKVSVTAVPEDGKANAALIRFLAKLWRVPRTSVDIVQGATDRRKVLFIHGDGQDLAQRLDQWMATIK